MGRIVTNLMEHEKFLSAAARQFEESAIRKAGALAGRVPDLISFAPGFPAAELFPWDELHEHAVPRIEEHASDEVEALL